MTATLDPLSTEEKRLASYAKWLARGDEDVQSSQIKMVAMETVVNAHLAGLHEDTTMHIAASYTKARLSIYFGKLQTIRDLSPLVRELIKIHGKIIRRGPCAGTWDITFEDGCEIWINFHKDGACKLVVEKSETRTYTHETYRTECISPDGVLDDIYIGTTDEIPC